MENGESAIVHDAGHIDISSESVTQTHTQEAQIVQSGEPKEERTLSDMLPTPAQPETVEKKKHRGLLIGGIAAAAAGVLAVTAGLGVFAGAQAGAKRADGAPGDEGKDRQASLPSAVATASPLPSETLAPSVEATPVPNETLAAIPELSTDLSAKQLGKLVYEQAWVNWRNSNVSANTAAEQQASGEDDVDQYALATAQANSDRYTKALFVDDWKFESNLVSYENQIRTENADSIGMSILTKEHSKADFPFGWYPQYESVQVVNQSANEMNLLISFTDQNNSGQFAEAESYPALLQESGVESQIAVRLLLRGDVYKIGDIQEFPAQ